MVGKNLVITVGDYAVEVTESVKGVGYCFDYLNFDNSTSFLEEMFTDAKFDFKNNGLWLYHNTPAFVETNYTGKTQPPEVDPFQSLPFWPGNKAKTYAGSLPAFSQSHYTFDG